MLDRTGSRARCLLGVTYTGSSRTVGMAHGGQDCLASSNLFDLGDGWPGLVGLGAVGR